MDSSHHLSEWITDTVDHPLQGMSRLVSQRVDFDEKPGVQLMYDLGVFLAVAFHDVTNEKMFVRATREAMKKGLDRLTRIDVLPSISVEEYEELLLHLMKCRSINISRVFSSVTRNVVLCELEMKDMSADYFRRWQRPPTDVEKRRFEQYLLANQVDHMKMLSSTKRLILLHASFRNKVGRRCSRRKN